MDEVGALAVVSARLALESARLPRVDGGYDAVGVVRYNGRVVGDGVPGPVSLRLRELLVADRKAHARPLTQA